MDRVGVASSNPVGFASITIQATSAVTTNLGGLLGPSFLGGRLF